MRVTIKRDRLGEIREESHRRIKQGFADGASEIQAAAQREAPVDTGRLRASISIRDTGMLSFEIYTDLEYAGYQEYGTRYQSGKSFMRPAYETNRLRIIDNFARELQTL